MLFQFLAKEKEKTIIPRSVLECAGMTALWFNATYRVVGKAVTRHRTPNEILAFPLRLGV
jgi:hypothetical protein